MSTRRSIAVSRWYPEVFLAKNALENIVDSLNIIPGTAVIAVAVMKIYTKTGDEGTTALFGGKRVSKADLRIESYGTIDELNSWVGVLRDQEINKTRQGILVAVQDRLFTIGSILATDPDNKKVKIPALGAADVTVLEKEIDTIDSSIPPLKSFILPGGHSSVSFGHVARTVCRRAERLVIALNAVEKVDPLVIVYMNRLS
jgi:cob(I)alamin adenosyltransferase